MAKEKEQNINDSQCFQHYRAVSNPTNTFSIQCGARRDKTKELREISIPEIYHSLKINIKNIGNLVDSNLCICMEDTKLTHQTYEDAW